MEDLYDIKAIESGLRGITSMMPRGSMPILEKAIDSSINKLNEPMQLAIIGKISSSKSTLVNAILGKQEVMSTGQKEVTYNVGWLKYGDPESDIIIHHKDGSPNTTKKKAEFEKWTTESKDSEIDNISYIEIFDDAEILKHINIIDTPGLDALRGKDSQNTLDFIKKVRPDAVIMLFTHSVSENILDIVSQYNTGSTFNPLNAIGVLSKIDVLWQEDFERKKTPLEIGSRMSTNRMSKDELIKKTLFNIYPISALLYLASSQFNDTLFDDIRAVAESDSSAVRQALKSVPNFLKEDININLSSDKRKQLIEQLGLYGVYLVIQLLNSDKSLTVNDVKERFKLESGATEFSKILHNHFGARAKLIKMESIFQTLIQSVKREKNTTSDKLKQQILTTIKQKISDIFASLVYEHGEYELLYKIYNNKIELDDDIRSEFINLCGEHGTSAPERLGMKTGTEVDLLINTAQEREKIWKKNISLEPDPEERIWMKIILSSYIRLNSKIKKSVYQYEQAKAFLYNH